MKINKDNIARLYNIVSSIVPLNFIINDNRNNNINRLNSIELPKSVQDIGTDISKQLDKLLSTKQKESVCYYENDLMMRYMGIGIFEEDKYIGSITIGPYLNYSQSNIICEKGVPRHIYDSIQVLMPPQEKSISNIIITMINSPVIKINAIGLESEADSVQNREIRYTLEDYKIDIIAIKERYILERQMLHYIGMGDEEGVLRVISQSSTNNFQRFPEMPLRNMKSVATIMNTLFRKAVEKNNIDEYYIHIISEKFATNIEKSKSTKVLDKIIIEMVKEYCNLVNEYSNNNYSLLVSNAINYINLNFSQEIGLSNISKDLFVHQTHLAKKFKKETSKTISEFINETRIREAKYMLKNTTLNIENIAYYVGYNDKKYFSKTFKKIAQKSPSEYRKYNMD